MKEKETVTLVIVKFEEQIGVTSGPDDIIEEAFTPAMTGRPCSILGGFNDLVPREETTYLCLDCYVFV